MTAIQLTNHPLDLLQISGEVTCEEGSHRRTLSQRAGMCNMSTCYVHTGTEVCVDLTQFLKCVKSHHVKFLTAVIQNGSDLGSFSYHS